MTISSKSNVRKTPISGTFNAIFSFYRDKLILVKKSTLLSLENNEMSFNNF